MQSALLVQFSAIGSLLQGRDASVPSVGLWQQHRGAWGGTQGRAGGTQGCWGCVVAVGLGGQPRAWGAAGTPRTFPSSGTPLRHPACSPPSLAPGRAFCVWDVGSPKNFLLQLGGSRASLARAGWDVGSPDPPSEKQGIKSHPRPRPESLLACPRCCDTRGHPYPGWPCQPPGGPPQHRATEATAKEVLYWGAVGRGGSAGGPAQLPPPQHVEVQVVDGLGAVLPIVDHCQERDRDQATHPAGHPPPRATPLGPPARVLSRGTAGDTNSPRR